MENEKISSNAKKFHVHSRAGVFNRNTQPPKTGGFYPHNLFHIRKKPVDSAENDSGKMTTPNRVFEYRMYTTAAQKTIPRRGREGTEVSAQDGQRAKAASPPPETRGAGRARFLNRCGS